MRKDHAPGAPSERKSGQTRPSPNAVAGPPWRARTKYDRISTPATTKTCRWGPRIFAATRRDVATVVLTGPSIPSEAHPVFSWTRPEICSSQVSLCRNRMPSAVTGRLYFVRYTVERGVRYSTQPFLQNPASELLQMLLKQSGWAFVPLILSRLPVFHGLIGTNGSNGASGRLEKEVSPNLHVRHRGARQERTGRGSSVENLASTFRTI